MGEYVNGFQEIPRLTEGDLGRIATDIVEGDSRIINLTGVDLVAVQQTADMALKIGPDNLLVYNVDGMDWNKTIKPLQQQAEAMLKKDGAAKAVFTSYDSVPWYKWELRQAAREIELEGILRDGDAVTTDALNRLDSQDTRRLLLWISPASSFHTDLLKSVAVEANFRPNDDEFFGFESVCWDLRNAGVVRWDIPSSTYQIRPFLRPLLAQRFKQESPELYSQITEFISSTVYA